MGNILTKNFLSIWIWKSTRQTIGKICNFDEQFLQRVKSKNQTDTKIFSCKNINPLQMLLGEINVNNKGHAKNNETNSY